MIQWLYLFGHETSIRLKDSSSRTMWCIKTIRAHSYSRKMGEVQVEGEQDTSISDIFVTDCVKSGDI
jgi:hypothetical protein